MRTGTRHEHGVLDGRMARFRLLLAVMGALALSAFLPATVAQAEGPNAVRDLAGCTTNTLPANDDDSTDVVPIGFTANFFGEPFTELYVNNNGNVTFNNPLGEFTPYDFTTAGDPIIAPFLADVDTGGAPGDGSLETTFGQTTVGSDAAFCVNWVNVGYFSENVDKLNSFQLLLIDKGSGNFDIEFNYDKVNWETGDASGGSGGFGGTSAAVGFANGDGDPSHFFVRDGSFENGALLNGGPKALISGMLNSGGQLGRYVFNVVNAPPTGATLTGEVQEPEFNNPIAGAPVEVCPTGGGQCRSRFTNSNGVYTVVNLPAGSYDVTAHSAPNGPEYADGHAGPVPVSSTSTFTQDVVLGPELTGPPPGTTIDSIGESANGIPTLYWDDPAALATTGCPNGSASYTVKIDGATVQSGAMTESPVGSGNYSATIPPLSPNTGDAVVEISIDCPSPPDETVEFAIYIDPSGFVRTTGGAPIPGAEVVLFRSSDADGPFIQVPDGSAIMSPGNRQNPDETDGTGHFGWDVIAGFYKVQASADGCGSVTSAVMNIPPPVTNLDLRLNCPTGGGGTPVTPQPLAAPPAKKCKKGQKLKKGKCVKKKKKKKGGKKSVAPTYSWEAGGLLEVGPPGAK